MKGLKRLPCAASTVSGPLSQVVMLATAEELRDGAWYDAEERERMRSSSLVRVREECVCGARRLDLRARLATRRRVDASIRQRSTSVRSQVRLGRAAAADDEAAHDVAFLSRGEQA